MPPSPAAGGRGPPGKSPNARATPPFRTGTRPAATPARGAGAPPGKATTPAPPRRSGPEHGRPQPQRVARGRRPVAGADDVVALHGLPPVGQRPGHVPGGAVRAAGTAIDLHHQRLDAGTVIRQ